MKRMFAALAALLLTAAPVKAAEAPSMSSPADSLIYLNGLNHLFVVDPVTFQTVQDVPMHGLAQLMAPTDDMKMLYLVDGQRERIEVIDRASGKHLETLSFTKPGKVRSRIYGLAIMGERLYAYVNETVFDGYQAGKIDKFSMAEPRIIVMDLKSRKRVASITMPKGILFLQPVGKQHLYAIGRDIFDIDVRTLKPVLKVALGEPATENEGAIIMYAEWVHPECGDDVNGHPYWTVDPVTGRTQIGLGWLDTRTGAFDHCDLGPPIHGQYPQTAIVSKDRKRGYMMMNELTEVDLVKRRVTRSKPMGASYYALNQAPDGSAIYMASAGNTLTEVDPATLDVRRKIELPSECFDIFVLPAAGGPKKPQAATEWPSVGTTKP